MYVLMIDQEDCNADPLIRGTELLDTDLTSVKHKAGEMQEAGCQTAIFKLTPLDAGAKTSARTMLERRMLKYSIISEEIGKAKIQ